MSALPKYHPATWDALRQMHTLGLTDAQRRALLTIRERIGAMLQERTPGTTATPSECWTARPLSRDRAVMPPRPRIGALAFCACTRISAAG